MSIANGQLFDTKTIAWLNFLEEANLNLKSLTIIHTNRKLGTLETAWLKGEWKDFELQIPCYSA